eukprot:5162352-Amphidinium_carterae.2
MEPQDNDFLLTSSARTLRQYPGIGFFLKNKWINFVDKLYFGHSRVAALTLKSKPMPVLLFSIYLPTAASSIEDKQESYDRIQVILSNIRALSQYYSETSTHVVSIVLVWNTMWGHMFPSAFSLEDAPQDVTESRDMLMEFLVETNSRIINAIHTNYFQNATLKVPATEHFVPPFVPTHFAQLDYIISKSCFSNAFSDCKALVATDSDHPLLKARFRFKLSFASNCSTSPKAEKYLPPSDPQ